jgi:hypothetical protein
MLLQITFLLFAVHATNRHNCDDKKLLRDCPFKETLQKSSLEKLHGAQVSKKQRVTKINSPFEAGGLTAVIHFLTPNCTAIDVLQRELKRSTL